MIGVRTAKSDSFQVLRSRGSSGVPSGMALCHNNRPDSCRLTGVKSLNECYKSRLTATAKTNRIMACILKLGL